MIILNENDLKERLEYAELIPDLKKAFALNPDIPNRQHLKVARNNDPDGTLLLMPAWNEQYLGVKIATVFPGNVARGEPAVQASYILKSGSTGEVLALIDGSTLTKIRTAAASGLASSFLSRTDAKVMLMIGAGALAGPLIQAHSAIRQFDRILVWNRTPSRIDALRKQLGPEFPIEVVSDLNGAVSEADLISCATLSPTPLVKGELVKPGTHVDLVGAYLPNMREGDTHLIQHSRVFVDTRIGATHEAGELVIAQNEGNWSMDRIEAELSELCAGSHPGRERSTDITVFKSVGASLEDLVAASLAYRKSIS